MKIIEIANQYKHVRILEKSDLETVIIFSNPDTGNEYLQLHVHKVIQGLREHIEYTFIHDNFPGQKRFFTSNIPIENIEQFQNDLIRMKIPQPY